MSIDYSVDTRPRRKTELGENSQYAVAKPDQTSPLRVFSVLCKKHGWHTEYIKFPCWCEDWSNHSSNSIVIWRGMTHRSWCVCEISKMSQEEMQEAAA